MTDPKPPCIVDGCDRPQVATSRCNSHRAALRRRDPAVRAHERERKLLARYGITATQADEIFAEADYTCHICGCPAEESYRGLVVDHDHVTGTVRGALCQACNKGIAHLADDPAILAAAIEYLARAELLRTLTQEEKELV